MTRFAWLWVPLVGCGPASVSGVVDGERVGGAQDAFFDKISLDFGPFGDFEYLVIMVTDFEPGCDILEEFLTTVEFSCDDLCEDYADLAQEYRIRDDHWNLVLTVNTSDGIDDEFDLDNDLGDGEFDADFLAYDTQPLHDQGACEDECDDGDLLDPNTEDAEDGTLELVELDADRIKGRFELDLGGDDRLSGGFTAHECDMDDWVWFY